MSEDGNGPALPPNAGGGRDGPAISGMGTILGVAGLADRRSAAVRHVHEDVMTSSRSPLTRLV